MIANIRPMKETDIDEVYAIEVSVHLSPWTRSILRDCVLVGYECMVLEISKEDANSIIGGYLIARIAENCCHLLNFCIAKPLQSKGYGRQLLQKLLNSLTPNSQLDSIVLEVRPSNLPALHLYHTLGFEQVAIKKGYYKDSLGIEDAILLKKLLQKF